MRKMKDGGILILHHNPPSLERVYVKDLISSEIMFVGQLRMTEILD